MIGTLILLLAFQITPELKQHVDAGLAAKAKGDLDSAIREFKRVAELAPKLAAAHVNLGAVYFEKKDYSEAIPALRKAVELDGKLVGAHAMLGAALLSQGYPAASIPHLEMAQADDLLGVALLESDRPREAVDRLELALLKRPDDVDLLYYLSQAHGLLSKQIFDRVQESARDSARGRQMLAQAMASSGNNDAAEKHFRAALERRADLRGVHYALGELYLQAGAYDKAEVEFRAEAKLIPGSAVSAYKHGFVLMNQGRAAEAIGELKRANDLQPGMPETLLELGKAMNATGDPASAAAYLQQVLEIEKDTKLAETAHFQLSQAYRKLGRAVEAGREMKVFQELRGKSK
jgi:tetratricopeptide (TPR) repeat protein